jgi:tetratricopeptide (TPR) repeat protein
MTDGPHNPAEEALAAARANAEAARAQGSSYAIALAHTQAGHALLGLHRPDEALTDFAEAFEYLQMLRNDGQHEHLRLLSMSSLSLAPPGESLGDLDTLEAWIRVGQAGALAALGRDEEARQAVAEARPWVGGWRRKPLRKALDSISDQLARQAGTGPEALAAAQRVARDALAPPSERLQARYEQAALLVDEGRYDEAMREALLLLRDCDDDPALTARVRQVLGATLVGLGREDDALVSLGEAFDGFEALGEQRAVVMAAPGLASRLIDAGQSAQATDVLRRALAAARDMRARREPDIDDAVEADLLGALATALDDAGDFDAAVTTFAESVAAADLAGDPVRAADARHGEAIARLRSGETEEAVDALALLDAARSAYESAGLGERAAGCQHEAAALLARLGSTDAALARYESAKSIYDSIPPIQAHDMTSARADVSANIALLQQVQSVADAQLPEHAFSSGGHRMMFGEHRGAGS